MLFDRDGKLGKIILNPQAWHDIFFAVNFYIAFFFLLAIAGEAVWAVAVLGKASFLTLHYSIYFGVDWLGGAANFFIFAGIAAVFFAANFALASAIFNKKKILSYLLMASASLILLCLLVIVSLMAYINWSNPAA